MVSTSSVTVDDAALRWSDDDRQRLELVAWLRRRGFGSRMLTEPAPPWSKLAHLERTIWPAVISAWEQLQPWRTSANPYLALALHITLTKEPR